MPGRTARSLKTDDTQNIPEQDQRKKHRGDAPEQEMYEFAVALLGAETNTVPCDKAGNGQKDYIERLFPFTGKFKHWLLVAPDRGGEVDRP